MQNLPRTTLILSIFVLLTGMASLFDTNTPRHGQEYLAQLSQGTSKEPSTIQDAREVVRTTEATASTTEPAVPVAPSAEGMYCPVLLENGYYVVDFTESRADGAVLEHLLSLPSGTYQVEAVSYLEAEIDGITSRGHEREQRWYGEILDGDGDLVAQTQVTRGMSPGEMVREIIADSIVLAGGKYTVVVQHGADLSEGSARIIPICVAFVEIGGVEDRGVSTSVEFQ